MSKSLTLLNGCLFIFLLLVLSPLQAQEEPGSKKLRKLEKKKARLERKLSKERFLHIGYVGTWNIIQDTKMARNIYQGPGFRLQVMESARSEKDFFQWGIRGGGIIGNPPSEESTLLGILADGGVSYLRRIRKDDPKNIMYVGAYAQFLYAYRLNNSLGNSALNWDMVGSVGPEFKWLRNIRLFRQDMRLEYDLKVPLLSYVRRYPGFSIGFEGADNFFSPVGVFTQIQSQISLVKRLGRRTDNKLAFSYEWNLYDFQEDDIHSLGVAYHGLGVTLLIDL